MPAREYELCPAQDTVMPLIEVSFQTAATSGASHVCHGTKSFIAGQFALQVRHDDEEISSSMTQEKALFLKHWILKVVMLGFLDFVLVHLAYFAAASYGAIATFPLLFAKGFLWLVGEAMLAEELKREAISTPVMYREVLTAFAHLDGPYIGVGGQCAFSCTARFVTTVASMPEAIDSVMDAVIAGASTKTITAAIFASFAASWRGKLFGIGDQVAIVGLAGVLTAIVVIATTLQFCVYAYFAVENLAPCANLASADCAVVYANMAALTEASSLKLLNDLMLRCLHRLERPQLVTQTDLVSIVKIIIKGIAENIPTTWLQASMLGLSLALTDLDRLSVIITVVSILTSMYTMLSNCPALYAFQGKMCRIPVSGCCALGIVIVYLSGLCMLVTIVHFAGICMCPNHNFEISALGCAEWASQ